MLSSCSAENDRARDDQVPDIPRGWKSVVALEGDDVLPKVHAALPSGAARTSLAGLENQAASFKAEGLLAEFSYGEFSYGDRAHPGCAAQPCTLRDLDIAGHPARVAISPSADLGAGLRTAYRTFIPLPAAERAYRQEPLRGTGLSVTIQCARSPRCPTAERIVDLIRFGGSSRE
jgi:hypothetical protein